MLNESQEAQTVRKIFAAINRDDFDSVLDLFNPNVVRVEPEGYPTSGTFHGIEKLQNLMAQGRSTWAEGSCEPERLRVVGDKVIAYLHAHIRLKDKEEWIDGRFADVFTFRAGKVIEMRTFWEIKEALAWVGIEENNIYDRELILQVLRNLGSLFLKSYKSEPIPEDESSMMSIFRRIEAESKNFLTSKLKTNIPFLEDELNTEHFKITDKAQTFWLFDSMDGAVQYMRHLPGWTFNLALIVEGEIVFSAIYDPLHDEMFWAEKGRGAFLADTRLRVRKRPFSQVMMAATSHPPFPNKVQGLSLRFSNSNKALLETYSFVRNFGPTALQIANVASGRIDVFGEDGADTFNWLPGILIAQEAGAIVKTLSGTPWVWDSESLLVGEASVVEYFISSLNNP